MGLLFLICTMLFGGIERILFKSRFRGGMKLLVWMALSWHWFRRFSMLMEGSREPSCRTLPICLEPHGQSLGMAAKDKITLFLNP